MQMDNLTQHAFSPLNSKSQTVSSTSSFYQDIRTARLDVPGYAEQTTARQGHPCVTKRNENLIPNLPRREGTDLILKQNLEMRNDRNVSVQDFLQRYGATPTPEKIRRRLSMPMIKKESSIATPRTQNNTTDDRVSPDCVPLT